MGDDEPTRAEGRAVYAAGFAALILLWMAGEIIAALADIDVPGSIIGLGAYLLLMKLSPAFASWTLPAARLFTRFLGALIVPAAVGLAAFAPFLIEVAPRLILVLVISTVFTGVTTALLYAGFKR
ncbi:CidA/LrgA family protein [Sphingoaurantiacus capsulatus]|uniref:CidA/LrgA family protein n=1 Tax=Sphingoaurantiacus capsulatus TaxID=1771310 RepID=A0ABV7X830_9SPHN